MKELCYNNYQNDNDYQKETVQCLVPTDGMENLGDAVAG